MNKDFCYQYFCTKLARADLIAILSNLVLFIFLFFFLFAMNNIGMFIASLCIMIIDLLINLHGMFISNLRKYPSGNWTKFNRVNDWLRKKSKNLSSTDKYYSFNNNNHNYSKYYTTLFIIAYSFISLLLASVIFTTVITGPQLPIIIFVLLGLLIYFSLIYYTRHPIYRSSNLSLKNIFKSTKPIKITKFVWSLIIGIYVLFIIIILFILKVLSKVRNVDIKKYYNINKPLKSLSKSKFTQLSNGAYLHDLAPHLTNICLMILLITFIVFVVIFIYVLSLSAIYSLCNDIGYYNEICFMSKIGYCILKFLVVTAPTIIVMNNIIKYFEHNLSYINIDAAILILLFFPFMELFYVLYTFNSLNKQEG